MSVSVQAEPEAQQGSDYAQLARQINEAGLLDRRPGYYLARLSVVGGLFVAGWAGFVALGDTWWQLLVAVPLAVIFAQIALVAHDLAHRQVFRRRKGSEVAGRIAGNLIIGMSYGWWTDKHTRHHANPNHEQLDPDVSPEVLVWSLRQAKASRGLASFVGRRQAYLFFPLLTLEGFNLKVGSFRALRRPEMKRRGLELVLMLIHFAGYLSALFLVLSPGKAVAFLLVHQAAFGVYLGSTFAPNHKGMPTMTSADDLDYLRKQVLTSRNVRGGWLIDVALGGLNYQIEHHLFPSMPTPNLRHARPIVQAYCAQQGISYEETGLIDSYRRALTHLHNVGEPIRQR